MEMSETREIAAPPSEVWAALFDPDVLRACVPGCEELSGSVEEGFTATVLQKVGPVKARFKGEITLSDIVEGEAATLSGEGKGGAAGFAKGAARIRLAPSDVGTTLSYDVEAKVGGKLAQLGSRIIDGFARKLADQFFARFQARLEGEEEEATPDESADAPPEKKGWMKRLSGG